MHEARPPYRVAVLTGLLVLAGYVATLAPSVTFWDAGELIASMKILGIPHPPGTPLFVMIGHVFGHLVPFGEFAWRTNLMSAVFSAAAASLWFLVVHEVLSAAIPGADRGTRLVRYLGAMAGSVLAAFGFTNWQNSNETEVYSVAAFTTALVAWLALRWRATRDTDRGPRYLVLIAYLLGVSIANHLLALLAGPAVVVFLAAVAFGDPRADLAERQREVGKVLLFAGLWALLLGVGLGSTKLSVVGGILFLGCAAYAIRVGAGSFVLTVLVVAAVGITPYLFLYLRSPQNPFINEAAPGTWDALLAVIRRDQYPPRGPLDDPRMLPGPDNPGRSLTIIGLQALNYLQYFTWQWGKSWSNGILGNGFWGVLHLLPTLLFGSLGLLGMAEHRRADRGSWWLLVILWLATGIGLMGYMNFKPGFSIGYDEFKDPNDHEVRERDYFFVISFIVWGLWAAMGLTAWVRRLLTSLQAPLRPVALAGFGLVAVPLVGNFPEADRRNGPDARLAADWAYSLLNSAPPNAVLFTFGDNDTFPLWWAQEVAGIRQDVRVVCLALARTEWYNRQLRDNPERPFDSLSAPAYWRNAPRVNVDWPLHNMTDADLRSAVPQRLGQAVTLRFGPYGTQLDSNSVIYTEDIVSIRILQQNFGRRPIVWGVASGGKHYGLEPLIVQEGIGMRLRTAVPDSADPNITAGLFRGPVDIDVTRRLAEEVYRYADLLERPAGRLETTAASMANTMSLPFVQLGFTAQTRGDTAAARGYFEKALRVSPNPGVQEALRQLSAAPARPDSTPSNGR